MILESRFAYPFSVDWVSKNRAAKIFHMDANLVRPPSLDSEPDKRIRSVCGYNLVDCAGKFSFRCACHGFEPFSVLWVAHYLSLDFSPQDFRNPSANCYIFFSDGASL